MKRIALIAASSLAAMAATFAIAQPQPIPPAGPDRDSSSQERSETREQRRTEWRERRAERMQARFNERLARLRADMKLKPEQAPLFERVEALLKRNAEQRRERWASLREQRQNFRDADIMERLDAMSARSGERAQRLKEMADTVRPLWATLSDEQKTVARRAVREAMAESRGMMRQMRDRMDERRGGRDRHDDRGPRRWRERGGDDDRRG